MKSKQEICIPIRNKKELKYAKKILINKGERIDEEYFVLFFGKKNYLICCELAKDWIISFESSNAVNVRVEIPLSNLDLFLKGCNMENKTSIDWLISLFNREGYTPVITESEIKQAKELQREDFITFHVEVMKHGLIQEGEKKWMDVYLPKIKEMAEYTYDQIFNLNRMEK